MRNFRGGGVEKFSRRWGCKIFGGLRNFRGRAEKFSGGEKFSGERVENFFFFGGGLILFRDGLNFSVEVTFFSGGVGNFLGAGFRFFGWGWEFFGCGWKLFGRPG